MKTTAAAKPADLPGASRNNPAGAPRGRIHPVVIYPFQQPRDFADLEPLYRWVARLGAEKEKYAQPITVMDRKTYFANEADKGFMDFRENTVARHSRILDAWCVDTCQMWYSGLGLAFEEGAEDDVYWLIPGDFNYGIPVGLEILSRLHLLAEICLEKEKDLCLGEITASHDNSKKLIDTYGTFPLLCNWFASEAREIRQLTERPRSEFLAMRHPFLRVALQRRWYAYEQTVVMLLQAVSFRQKVSRFSIGDISDLPGGRESLASALQQVERTERVLKTIWCERWQTSPGWVEQYQVLESQSEQVRHTALILLRNLLAERS